MPFPKCLHFRRHQKICLLLGRLILQFLWRVFQKSFMDLSQVRDNEHHQEYQLQREVMCITVHVRPGLFEWRHLSLCLFVFVCAVLWKTLKH